MELTRNCFLLSDCAIKKAISELLVPKLVYQVLELKNKWYFLRKAVISGIIKTTNNTVMQDNKQKSDIKNHRKEKISEKILKTSGGIIFRKGRYTTNARNNDPIKQST